MYIVHIPYIHIYIYIPHTKKKKEIHTCLSHAPGPAGPMQAAPQLLHGGTTFPRAPWVRKQAVGSKPSENPSNSRYGCFRK